jgi:hypothetical protein
MKCPPSLRSQGRDGCYAGAPRLQMVANALVGRRCRVHGRVCRGEAFAQRTILHVEVFASWLSHRAVCAAAGFRRHSGEVLAGDCIDSHRVAEQLLADQLIVADLGQVSVAITAAPP